jgi:hypothetical protein
MALFGDSVPREFYEDMRQQRDRLAQELSHALAEQSALIEGVLAVKRHDLGMPPAGFTAADPLSTLGKKTRAAIEEMSGGLADLRSHHLNWALTQAMKVEDPENPEFDADLAQRIYDGDPG